MELTKGGTTTDHKRRCCVGFWVTATKNVNIPGVANSSLSHYATTMMRNASEKMKMESGGYGKCYWQKFK